jgi:hypothetical protein
MSASLNINSDKTIFQEMTTHVAWVGEVSGLTAEKMLRGKTPYLYVVRAGEKSKKANEENYYVTFVSSDASIRHQPITISENDGVRHFENTGSFIARSFDEVLHLMLHCKEGQCSPLQTSV